MADAKDVAQLAARLDRIEKLLQLLVAALAEDEAEDPPALTLDGQPSGAPRPEGVPL